MAVSWANSEDQCISVKQVVHLSSKRRREFLDFSERADKRSKSFHVCLFTIWSRMCMYVCMHVYTEKIANFTWRINSHAYEARKLFKMNKIRHESSSASVLIGCVIDLKRNEWTSERRNCDKKGANGACLMTWETDASNPFIVDFK